MILFAHTKFGLIRIQGSRVKRGRGAESAPRSERVFQIPVQIGLTLLGRGGDRHSSVSLVKCVPTIFVP